jgi:hypothetical protein
VIPTAPLRARNHLAEIILGALEKPGASRELAALAEGDAVAAWLSPEDRDCWPLIRQRAQAAAAALAARPSARLRSRVEVLDAAAVLFDARLYFEVHELLEPAWREAASGEREALQGLIQIAVGYQHLANGNFAGARALLDEGRRRLRGQTLEGLDLDAFGDAVGRTLPRIFQLDWHTVPVFPRKESS